MSPRVLAAGFSVIAIGAVVYLLIGLRAPAPAPSLEPPSPPVAAPVPPPAPSPPPPTSPSPPRVPSEPLVAPPPGSPVLPAPPSAPELASPLPPPSEPQLQITRDEAQQLEPIVSSIRRELDQVRQDYDLGRLGKKDVGEMLERAERDATRRLERILGQARARQYLETMRSGGEIRPTSP